MKMLVLKEIRNKPDSLQKVVVRVTAELKLNTQFSLILHLGCLTMSRALFEDFDCN